MPKPVPSAEFSLWIDAFRWLAAASVLVTHTGIRMLAPISELPSPSWRQMAWAFFAGFDHQAVMVFFVLSGFLVGGGAVQELRQTGRIAIVSYVTRRVVRLCLVLWPGLLLSGACAAAAARMGVAAPADSFSAADLGCNAVFLQTAACPQWAGNGALWSLFNEFWYYLLFPPLLLAAAGSADGLWRLATCVAALAGLGALTTAQFTGAPLAPYMLIWLAGVAAAAAGAPVMRSKAAASALFLAALLAVRLFVRRGFAPAHPALGFALDLGLALLFANLLLTLRASRRLPAPPGGALHRHLAGFSFSLYCTHIPVLTLGIAALAGATGLGSRMRGDGGAEWLAVAAALSLCLGVAWSFAQVTEAQTARVRNWLRRPPPRLVAR